MNYLSRLKSIPVLEGMKDEDLKALSELVKEHKTPAGEDLITEGETGSEMYILIEGKVDVIKKTIFGDPFVVASMDAGMHCVFGEIAMIDNDKRSATVRATSDCVTLSINRKNFDKFCDDRPECGVKLLRLISMNLARNIRKENDNLRMVYQALIEEIETG